MDSSLLLHSFRDTIHGIGLPTFKVGPSTSLSAIGSQQTLPETSQLWLETVLLWSENVSHLFKVFHSNCYHDLIPKTKALFYLLPDFFSNCANNVTRVCAQTSFLLSLLLCLVSLLYQPPLHCQFLLQTHNCRLWGTKTCTICVQKILHM